MRILIDINHPAHVHYFKNSIKIMERKGHKFLIISRNKEIEHYLLRKYNIEFISRGVGKKTLIGKVFYFFYATFILLVNILKFKPDIVISFGTPYPAVASWALGKPHISINDTEHAKMHHLLTDPFSNVILTPSCYTKDLGTKQIRFNGYMELCYLYPKYFIPDNSILTFLGVKEEERYVVIRFVSWNAVHDQGHKGLTLEHKIRAVRALSNYAKVFISSENALPNELSKYKIDIPPEKMHDVLAYASLFFGESATMASESACLGIPAVYLDNDGRGYTDEEEVKYGMVFNYSESIEDQKNSIKKALELLGKDNLNEEFKSKRQNLLNEKIDVTAFLVWFFENYPKSAEIMKNRPEYQNRFK